MTTLRYSLRGRLLLSMFFVFALGLGGAIALHPFEERGALLSRAFSGLLREPYQDFSVLFLFSLASVFVIWVVAEWSLRGLTAVASEAASIRPEAPNVRLSMDRLPSEVRPLVEAVNRALDRLFDAYELERRFVADAAHQLRTPVAVLKLRIQRQSGDVNPDWSAIGNDVAALERMVNDLLDLAGREAGGARLNLQDVNLARIAREAVADLLPMAEGMGRLIEPDLPDSLPAMGHAGELRKVIGNLIENALFHGSGVISLHGEARGSRCAITVSDEGPQLPEQVRSAAFGRFWKKMPNSPGSGLGLAIAEQIVRRHGGAIRFLQGDAVSIEMSLPRLGSARPIAAGRENREFEPSKLIGGLNGFFSGGRPLSRAFRRRRR